MKNLSVGRNKKLLLKNINVQLSAGQKWFFYGQKEAKILYYLFSGLTRDYSGSIHVNGQVPAERLPEYFRNSHFIPSYFPIYNISGDVYLRHFRNMYPNLDERILSEGLKMTAIDSAVNLQKLRFSKRKLFHLILALAVKPYFLMIKELFHGLSESDKCAVHNVLKDFIGPEQCVVMFGGRLTDYRDLVNHLAVFYNGTCLRTYSLRELAVGFLTFHVRTRRILEHAPLYSGRLVRGWKILDENPQGKLYPPDFSLLDEYFQSSGDMIRIKDRMDKADE